MYRFAHIMRLRSEGTGLLATLSGRDPALLRRCPADERRGTMLRGLALGVTVALHFAAMAAALSVLGLPLVLAMPLAMLTAAGVLAADGTILLTADLDAAESAARRAEAASGPRLTGRLGRIAGRGARVLFALAIAPALSLFLAVHVCDPELRGRIVAAQQELDAPFREAAQRVLDERRAALAAERDAARADLALLRDGHRAALDAHDARLDAAMARVETLDRRGETLLDDARRAEARARAERAVALCERAGGGPDCDAVSSGDPGEGRLFDRAEAQAAASARDARAARGRRAALLEERAAADRALDAVLALPRPAAPTTLREATAQAEARDLAVARFDAAAGASLTALVTADPARPVLDADGLALRLETLWRMIRENPGFGGALGLVALAALALDLLPFAVSAATRPGAYHLHRGAALEQTVREAATRRDTDDIRSAALREKAEEARWRGDETMRDLRRRQRRAAAELSLDSLRGRAA